MSGKLEIIQWIQVHDPVYAVALSADGQYIAAGSERGVHLFNQTGQRLLSYPQEPLPVRQLAATSNMEQLYVGARQGYLIRLDVTRQENEFSRQGQAIYETRSDLNRLSLSSDGQVIAVGHISPGLSVLQTDGQPDERIMWRRYRDDGTATEGDIWSVAIAPDGNHIYVGSASVGSNRLAKLATANGAPAAHRMEDGTVTALTALPNNQGVAAALTDEYGGSRIVIYDAALTPVWESEQFNERITALAADARSPLLAVAVGFEVEVINTELKQIVARHTVKSIINDLAFAQGRFLAVATQLGDVALLSYIQDQFSL